MNKKKIGVCVGIVFSLILTSISFLYAFDWAQKPVRASSLFSEIRGDSFNAGVVFASPGEVAVAEEGHVIMMLASNSSNMGWFESPLGNAVIVAHKNDMMSVYSNLNNIRLEQGKREVVAGEVLGVSGQSAWSDGSEGAGFQIMDTKMKRLINPAVLMQDLPQSQRVPVTGVIAVNRNGESFPLYNGAIFKAGAYTLYMDRPATGMIHGSSVALNGEVKETINYDTLEKIDNSLVVFGNKSYHYNEIYIQDDKMRLADILLARGTNTIEISLSNVGETESFARHRISVN